MSRNGPSKSAVVASLLAWCLSIGVGFAYLMNYEATPGTIGSPPPNWSEELGIRFNPQQINVVMSVHPRCPCTRASLENLRELIGSQPDRFTAHLLFWKPKGGGEDWNRSDLWDLAKTIPNGQIYVDENGDQAKRLGVTTSGHVVVFGKDGNSLFSGGLTDARGQFGHSQGLELIEGLASERNPLGSRSTPVYGCPLFSSSTTCTEETESCPN